MRITNQIKNVEQDTKLGDMGKMLFAVCDYKRVNGNIPRFDVGMKLHDEKVTFV